MENKIHLLADRIITEVVEIQMGKEITGLERVKMRSNMSIMIGGLLIKDKKYEPKLSTVDFDS